MRWLTVLFLAATITVSAAASNVTLVRVWPEWRNADAFDRIREYFGGPENDGRRIVERTQAADRAGLYFLVRVRTATALPHATLVLQVVRPDNPAVKRYTFTVSLPAKGKVVQLGLTGADWPGGRNAHPVAWKVTLLDAAGQPVASRQSFLWAKPAS